MTKCFILKSEPDVYSIDDLERDGKTGWNGVRNHQAKIFLKEMKLGDTGLIYHTDGHREIVGICRCSREAYPDPDPEHKGDWVQVEVSYVQHVKTKLTLAEMKTVPELKDMWLLKIGRLSVAPVSDNEWKWIQSKIL